MSQHQFVEQQLRRITNLVPAGADTKEYLRNIFASLITDTSHEREMGLVALSESASTNIYASARFTIEFLDEPDRILQRPEGIIDLGTIEWVLRPALLIADGIIDIPKSPPWSHLPNNIIEMACKSVCRIDLTFGVQRPWQLGTGFIIGNSENGMLGIMTNAHVVQEALRFGWPNLERLDLSCDFERYSDSAGKPYVLTKEYFIHPHYDLAILFLDLHKYGEASPSSIMQITSYAPNPIEDLEIGVIGHPSFNSVHDPFPKYFGFGDRFGVKRFSPGYVRTIEQRFWGKKEIDVLLHDATTLSGSSGSCILDLKSMRVVGLHFGGWPVSAKMVPTSQGDLMAALFESNGAVPLWLLSNDPMFRWVSFS